MQYAEDENCFIAENSGVGL